MHVHGCTSDINGLSAVKYDLYYESDEISYSIPDEGNHVGAVMGTVHVLQNLDHRYYTTYAEIHGADLCQKLLASYPGRSHVFNVTLKTWERPGYEAKKLP